MSLTIFQGLPLYQEYIIANGRQRDIPARVHAALVEAGWEQPSNDLINRAAYSSDAESGMALFSALKGAGDDDWMTNELYKQNLPERALRLGAPRVFQYLRDLYTISEPLEANMIIQAVESRQSGVVEVISWLLDQGLDVNFLQIPLHPDPDTRAVDPRDKAEQPWKYSERPWSSKKTALHAAAWKGNADAVHFRLERGANPHTKNGLGKPADIIARSGGYEESAEMVERILRETKM